MSGREAVFFIITSDKKQTFKEAILQEKEVIMKVMRFVRWVTEIEIACDPSEFFDQVFLDREIYYDKYSYTPHIGSKRIYDVEDGESFIAIFSVNSAGSWEGLQVVPARSGLSPNIEYYTFRETIYMPS